MRAFNMLLLCAESGSVIDMLSQAQVRPLFVGTKVLDTPHGVTKVLLAPFGCRLKVSQLLGCTSRGCHYMPADSFAPRGAELWSLASSTTTTFKRGYGRFFVNMYIRERDSICIHMREIDR